MSRAVLSVLIVEDAEDPRELHAFQAAGFRVLCAESVANVMKAMRAEAIDAVVTDFHLPDGDGLTMLDAAAHDGVFRRDMPAVLCTACSDAQRPNARVVGVFMKPVDVQKLVSVVREPIEGTAVNEERASEEIAS